RRPSATRSGATGAGGAPFRPTAGPIHRNSSGLGRHLASVTDLVLDPLGLDQRTFDSVPLLICNCSARAEKRAGLPGRAGAQAGSGGTRRAATAKGRRAAVVGGPVARVARRSRYLYKVGSGVVGLDPPPNFTEHSGCDRGFPYANLQVES